jgi:hypothetical protein
MVPGDPTGTVGTANKVLPCWVSSQGLRTPHAIGGVETFLLFRGSRSRNKREGSLFLSFYFALSSDTALDED